MRTGSIANTSLYNIHILTPPASMDNLYPIIDRLRTITVMSNYAIAERLGVGDVVVCM